MRRYYRQWEETFDEVSTDLEELIDAGDKVVAAVRGLGRMKGSDSKVDIHYALVLSFRDGKISKGPNTSAARRPSKPPGCRSRRCRRTWRSYELALRHGTRGTCKLFASCTTVTSSCTTWRAGRSPAPPWDGRPSCAGGRANARAWISTL
jgi:hypothetical protein